MLKVLFVNSDSESTSLSFWLRPEAQSRNFWKDRKNLMSQLMAHHQITTLQIQSTSIYNFKHSDIIGFLSDLFLALPTSHYPGPHGYRVVHGHCMDWVQYKGLLRHLKSHLNHLKPLSEYEQKSWWYERGVNKAASSLGRLHLSSSPACKPTTPN